MFCINDIVYLNGLRRKGKVIGVNFKDQHVTYLIEDNEENIHEMEYYEISYASNGYGYSLI